MESVRSTGKTLSVILAILLVLALAGFGWFFSCFRQTQQSLEAETAAREQAESRLATVTGERDELETRLSAVTSEKESTELVLAEVNASKDQADAENAVLTSEKAKAEEALAEMTTAHSQISSDYTVLKAEKDRLDADYAALTEAGKQAEAEHAAFKASSEASMSEMTAARESVEAELAALTADKEETERALSAAQKELDEYRSRETEWAAAEAENALYLGERATLATTVALVGKLEENSVPFRLLAPEEDGTEQLCVLVYERELGDFTFLIRFHPNGEQVTVSCRLPLPQEESSHALLLCNQLNAAYRFARFTVEEGSVCLTGTTLCDSSADASYTLLLNAVSVARVGAQVFSAESK